jgi:hypothetical protein
VGLDDATYPLTWERTGIVPVELIKQTVMGGASWPILLAAALILVGVWLGTRARNLHSGNVSANVGSNQTIPTTFVYDDAPTVRVNDSKRVDRLHRTLTLSIGEHVDLLDLTFDRIPRLRLSFAGFDQEYARIAIELGGAIAGCGSLVKEISPNQFLVPRAAQEEQRASILHFHGKGEAVSFLRVKVSSMHPEQQSVELNVLHVCGQWNA